MVEQKPKLTKLMLLDGPTSKATNAGIIARLKPLKKYVFMLTSDNGKEFSDHGEINEKRGSDIYFCVPYHSMDRGLNKKTNGLVGPNFPKGADFSKLIAIDAQRGEDLLNNRPRKALKRHSPNKIFAKFTAPPQNYARGL